MQTVAFCNIDVIADLDPMFAKLFKLAQFMIEYMLHSQVRIIDIYMYVYIQWNIPAGCIMGDSVSLYQIRKNLV